jgi:hypothetical protein
MGRDGFAGSRQGRLGAAGTPFLPALWGRWAGAPPAGGAGPTLRDWDRWDARWDIFPKLKLSHLNSLRPNVLRRKLRWDGTEQLNDVRCPSDVEQTPHPGSTVFDPEAQTRRELAEVRPLPLCRRPPLRRKLPGTDSMRGEGDQRRTERERSPAVGAAWDGTLKSGSRGRCLGLAPNSRRSESGCLARSGRPFRRPNRTAPASG